MTLTEKAMEYARAHLQPVRVCWIDCREPSGVDAVEAVEMCSAPGVSWNIMGVVAQDKRLETMLNELLDRE